MPYPQQQNPMMPYGQQQVGQLGQGQQQPQQQNGLPWWSYLSPATFIGSSLANSGQGQQAGQQGDQQEDPWSWWETFFGKPGGIKQIGGIDELLQQGLQQYQNPYEGFEPIKKDALNTFKSDIVPYLQSRFNGGSNHFSSNTLKNQLSSAGATLADRLQSAQAQYGQNARNSALSAIQTSKPQYFQQGGQKGGFDYIMDILKLVASTVPFSSAGNSPGSAGPGGAPGGFSLPPLPRQPDFSDIYKRGASR